jgi:DNA-binding IscR family transcriptional regulator
LTGLKSDTGLLLEDLSRKSKQTKSFIKAIVKAISKANILEKASRELGGGFSLLILSRISISRRRSFN